MTGRVLLQRRRRNAARAAAGRLRCVTELGALEVAPGEIAVIPRGVRFRVELPRRRRRAATSARTTAQMFRLPELGPIGSNGLANARDFLAPGGGLRRPATARRDGRQVRRQPVGGRGRSLAARRRAWHGNLAPYKYDLSRFKTIDTVSFDHPDPSIFTVLTSPSDIAGHGQRRLRDLSAALDGRRGHVPPAVVPPQRHERVHGADPRRVRRQGRRLRARRREPAQLHDRRTARTPRPSNARVQRRTQAAQDRGHHGLHVRDAAWPIRPTRFAMEAPDLQHDYSQCWQGLKRRFPG